MHSNYVTYELNALENNLLSFGIRIWQWEAVNFIEFSSSNEFIEFHRINHNYR